MSLVDDLAAEAAQLQLTDCKVCRILRDMDNASASALQSAFAGKLPATKIAAVLRRNSYDVGDTTVKRHRTEGHA